MTITTPIIPTQQHFANLNAPQELDYKAICVFAAIGFFLDTDTYYKNKVVLKPASYHKFDTNHNVIESTPYFKWHYSPRSITFNEALDEFTHLFERIIDEQVKDDDVILPLSGGLDSRTQATALKALNKQVFSYSYDFANGYPETKIAKAIAEQCDFPFESYTITPGYLWDVIDELSKLNQCYSDFTSPRQMAVINGLKDKGTVFSLGHWGDVLFDSMNLPQLTFEEEVDVLIKKLIKRGGLHLANSLWKVWQLEGDFEMYFRSRIEDLLKTIDIKNTNAKLRAFKSLYWAPRWTSVNLSVFESVKPITLPYYDDRICEFICTVPEDYLKGRQLQIAYIKQRKPELAKITWQDHRPYNLYNYKKNVSPYNLPYKVCNKLEREISAVLGKPYIQRNWELQFLGQDNSRELERRLYDANFQTFIPKGITEKFYNDFKEGNKLDNAHALNMLLVLSQFYKHRTSA